MQALWFGKISHDDGRAIQARYIHALSCAHGGEILLFCEHSPVVTLGKRSRESALESSSYFLENEIPVVQVERGGEATYHGPGQLLIYPVVNLRVRRIGVRAFVERGLSAIVSVLQSSHDLDAEMDLEQAGVWIRGPKARRKIASVGLRIRRGITDYGFSLNVNCDLEPFRHFLPCGLSGDLVTSIEEEGVKASVEDTNLHRSIVTGFLGEEFK